MITINEYNQLFKPQCPLISLKAAFIQKIDVSSFTITLVMECGKINLNELIDIKYQFTEEQIFLLMK